VLAGALRTEIAAADLALLEAQVADRVEDSRRVLTFLDGAPAQRRMLSDARRGAPYYWASYQVSGDGSTMTADAAGLFRSARPASRP